MMHAYADIVATVVYIESDETTGLDLALVLTSKSAQGLDNVKTSNISQA